MKFAFKTSASSFSEKDVKAGNSKSAAEVFVNLKGSYYFSYR